MADLADQLEHQIDLGHGRQAAADRLAPGRRVQIGREPPGDVPKQAGHDDRGQERQQHGVQGGAKMAAVGARHLLADGQYFPAQTAPEPDQRREDRQRQQQRRRIVSGIGRQAFRQFPPGFRASQPPEGIAGVSQVGQP